jgi:protocatechuate 3,4-dioxygenase beta subunit
MPDRSDSATADLPRDLQRRRIIALAALIMADRVLTACSASTDGGAAVGDGGTSDASSVAAADSTSACVANGSRSAAEWATGGTAAMTDKASYPNPFAPGCNTPASCSLTCELTQGPCYSSQSVEIQDISYGYTGLPMRVVLQLLDEACAPVVGAVVDVWHVSPVGKYSGDDAANEDVAFCTGNDDTFAAALYFRGKQVSDTDGIVTFDSCFPGWYSSRTVHVHLTVSVNGTTYVTTQLAFADALDDEIISTQPVYKDRGARDTTNATDTVLPSTGYQAYLFSTARMSDGAMLAWKTIVLRRSTSEALCGAGTEGGPPTSDAMGPPPDAMGPPLERD